jgi:hypothetical protein
MEIRWTYFDYLIILARLQSFRLEGELIAPSTGFANLQAGRHLITRGVEEGGSFQTLAGDH